MSDALNELRDRYIGSLMGWIPFQRVIVFCGYLVALVAPTTDAGDGLLLGLAHIRLNTLAGTDDAILWSSRIRDICIALLLASTVGYLVHGMRMLSFKWFVSIRDPSAVLTKLREAARAASVSVEEMDARVRIDVDRREKELRRRAAMTELLLGFGFLPWFFWNRASVLDLCASAVALLGCVAMVWTTYLFYISRVLPALALSAGVSRGSLSFGDGLIDEERILFGRLEQKRKGRSS